MESKIVVRNLKKSFGRLEVLKDISVEIAEGEVVCMIGPSGSGKSTFLRCLNRLESITAGDVVVDGHPMNDPNTNLNKAVSYTHLVLNIAQAFAAIEGAPVEETAATAQA